MYIKVFFAHTNRDDGWSEKFVSFFSDKENRCGKELKEHLSFYYR